MEGLVGLRGGNGGEKGSRAPPDGNDGARFGCEMLDCVDQVIGVVALVTGAMVPASNRVELCEDCVRSDARLGGRRGGRIGELISDSTYGSLCGRGQLSMFLNDVLLLSGSSTRVAVVARLTDDSMECKANGGREECSVRNLVLHRLSDKSSWTTELKGAT